MNLENVKIAVIGLGYVGLPLAVEYGKKYRVIGFDINKERVAELQRGEDKTLEADLVGMRQAVELFNSTGKVGLTFSSDTEELRQVNTYIVTVPTPIDQFNNPDLTPLLKASEMLGKVIKKGDIIIYESTVYPGCTEEDCVPVLEKFSGLCFNQDFFCGYSPERINPGDKINTLTKIRKITSGSTPEVADKVDALYNSILENGTHRAPNMKVAEAAKAVENAQRDVNISFMNELALICDRVGIDTNDVIEAAGTKWNFLKYRPGLVGGHCISVDPYYLAHKAKALGYNPEVILSGRRVNNSIAKFIADKTLKLMIQHDHKIKGANVLVLGVTFKENCPDCRNTKVVDICNELEDFGCNVDIYDPWADPQVVKHEYKADLISAIDPDKKYEAVIACVAHDQFKTFDFEKYKSQGAVIFDVKGFVDRKWVDARL
ncbi:MAG: nucleotide sugar dehydrogenase [Bacteroidetes bacterium]|uniref:Nucleotide sugar dehydrogenase n=1 Tax=Candidatus Gallipaludibacter merdavium TaxID=2840839 RepID=A0A9D9N3I4_9BACT|nr:nucleotide sugar dehydrogenase [Candidatus Gallipaludibacter merdavium]